MSNVQRDLECSSNNNLKKRASDNSSDALLVYRKPRVEVVAWFKKASAMRRSFEELVWHKQHIPHEVELA